MNNVLNNPYAQVLSSNHNLSATDAEKCELSLRSFVPGGDWVTGDMYLPFSDSRDPQWIQDTSSGAVYLNQPTNHLRLKLFFLTGFLAGILGGNALSLTINAIYRALKVGSLSHFWLPISLIDSSVEQSQVSKSYHFKTRCVKCAKDIARIVATPFAWLGLFFASFVGAMDPRENGPRDGVKIFSSIEIAMYGGFEREGHFAWAPCYQPNATCHMFGGSIDQQCGY